MCIRIRLISVVLALSSPLSAQEVSEAFCFEAPHDQICAVFPDDVPEFSAFFEYMVISGDAQAPFDRQAWQAFVALNWHELNQGPARVNWRNFAKPTAVMGKNNPGHCAGREAHADVIIEDLEQSDGNPLIDKHGNYIVYETRMNSVVADYIARVKREGEAVEIDFPQGRNAERPASVLVKTAWRILDAPSPKHVTALGLIAIPPERSISGEALCLDATLGLVGMHVVTKVESGNGDEWIWATFEHRENTPIAADARDINAIYGPNLFPQGCVAPSKVDADFLLFDAAVEGTANTPPPSEALWASSPPYARAPSGDPLPASQVVRCWEIFGPTQDTNALWQEKLRGTPLELYMLISSQWRGANKSPYLEHGELPRFLSNSTMETYVQIDRRGTCLGCHAGATTATGEPSDFTFLLTEFPE